jgi:hypothetical protein
MKKAVEIIRQRRRVEQAIWDYVATNGETPISELCEELGVSVKMVGAMVKRSKRLEKETVHARGCKQFVMVRTAECVCRECGKAMTI